MSISLKIKILLQDLKKCKHLFSYCLKTILNDYTKEICAKQVANQSDFLKAFLHLEPLLYIEQLHEKIFLHIQNQRRRSSVRNLRDSTLFSL